MCEQLVRIWLDVEDSLKTQGRQRAFLLDFTSFFQDPLVRIPSRAFSYVRNCLECKVVPGFFILTYGVDQGRADTLAKRNDFKCGFESCLELF